MPRSTGHRPGRTAMAAGGRAGRTRGPAGGREAVSASAESPTSGRPRGPCQRTELPPGGRLRGARGAWLPWAPGAQQCSRGGAQRQPRRAPSQPPRGARSRGAGRRAPQNPDWSDGAGRRRGGAAEEGPGGAASAGHPQHWGSLRATPEAPPGRSWGSGRGGLPPPLSVSRDRDKTLEPGVDCFSGSGITLVRQSAHRWPGRGPGLRRPRRSASLRRAARLWSAPGRFRCSPCLHPCLPAALRGRQYAAVCSRRASWMGDCRRGPGAQPARKSRQAPTVSPSALTKTTWWASGARAAAWPQAFLIPPRRWPKGNNLRAQRSLKGAWCCLRPERARRWRRGRDAGTRRVWGATNSWGRIEVP